MKKLRTVIAAVLLAVAAITFTAGPVAVVGCKSPSRQAYTTLASVGEAVDVAEREYMDRVVSGQIKADEQFTRIQAGYSAFQQAYKAALAAASNDQNALAPANIASLAAKLVSDIKQAEGGK